MSTQEDPVAEHNISQKSIETSSSFTIETAQELLGSHEDFELMDWLSAIRKFNRDVAKISQKNVKILDAMYERAIAKAMATPLLIRMAERLDKIDEKLDTPREVTKLTYATVAASASKPIETPPKRTRTDEVTIKIVRDTDAEAKVQGSGETMKTWVEDAMKGSGVKGLSNVAVAGIQPHRSGTKVTVRFKCSEDADKVVRNAAQCSSALGEGAKVSVPHFGVVIQDVPLFYDPAKASYRQDLHAQNPSLIPDSSSIVDARWLVPKDRLPNGRKTGSWVVFVDNQQAADNMIDQGVRVQALLLNARRYFSGPRQCRKCQRWGHLSYSCRARSQTCAHCGGQHASSDCPHPEARKCANCGGDHEAFHPTCETRRTESLRAQASQAGASVYFAGQDFTFLPFPTSLA